MRWTGILLLMAIGFCLGRLFQDDRDSVVAISKERIRVADILLSAKAAARDSVTQRWDSPWWMDGQPDGNLVWCISDSMIQKLVREQP